ncbi:major facilitator superfamily domain-containing protein [Infundibulicybe gibba]|nr:major facilitator superfamily domain-containing protein [Infundibulicybe gibba]
MDRKRSILPDLTNGGIITWEILPTTETQGNVGQKSFSQEKRTSSPGEGGLPDAEERKHVEKRLLRKLDLRMSVLVVMFIMNYLECSAARLRGFEQDLGLVDNQFAIVLAVYFAGYITMQIPSNMILNHIARPSLYLPGAMLLWGIISCLTGIFGDVVVCRFFLGVTEAAFFPGVLLLLSRSEMGLRTCIFYCGLLISVAFGSLIASGILDSMQGILNHAAWRYLSSLSPLQNTYIMTRWLYFIEGAFTAQRVPLEERTLALLRIREDMLHHKHPVATGQFAGLELAISDWKVWWLALIYTIVLLSLSFNAYLPTVVATLGYPVTDCFAYHPFITAIHSDRTRERYWHIVVPFVVAITGFAIGMCTMNTGARYFSMFLVGQLPAGYICLLAWISNSIADPPAKRAVALGLISGLSQVGAIAGSFTFPVQWGPSYRISFGISLAASAVVIGMCTLFRMHLASENGKNQAEEKRTGQPKGFRYICEYGSEPRVREQLGLRG